MYTTDVVKKLASTGANLIIDAKNYTPDAAKDIVKRAAAAGGQVTIRNCRKYTTDVVNIMAQIGGKFVTLDLTEVTGPDAAK